MSTADLALVLTFAVILLLITLPLIAYKMDGPAAVNAIVEAIERLLKAFATVIESVGKAIQRSYGPSSGGNPRETDANGAAPAELPGGPGEPPKALPERPESLPAAPAGHEPNEGTISPRVI
jgi:hypothetical protein